MLLQSALQLLMALAQPRMLLLLRVELLHGQNLFESATATHARRASAIETTQAVAAGVAGQAYKAWVQRPEMEPGRNQLQ